jgi:hypothetical protein
MKQAAVRCTFELVVLALPLVAYRCVDTSRAVPFTVSALQLVYATNLSRLQRETKREKEREISKRHVAGAHSIRITALLLLLRLSCY